MNQDGEIVVSGSAEVIAPKEKVRRPKVYLPAVHFDDKEMRFREIMGRVKARNLASVATAIVYPVDADSLASAAEAARQGIIVPILIGPESTIREVAKASSVDLDAFEIEPASNSREAAALRVSRVDCNGRQTTLGIRPHFKSGRRHVLTDLLNRGVDHHGPMPS